MTKKEFQAFTKLLELVYKDDCTNLYNQRALKKDLIKLKSTKYSILVLDLDHFKQINDNYGHTIGNLLLIKFGAFLRQNIRETDLFYRFGGDEFVIIFPHISIENAKNIAERIIKALKTIILLKKYPGITLSVSIGISDNFINADSLMYKSKKAGRSQVSI